MASKAPKLSKVKSGIQLDGMSQAKGAQSFLTSRTARVLLAGAGFLADAYDLFVINLVLRLLRDEYPEHAASGNLQKYEGMVASAALIGSICGQLIAGSLADIVGRKKIFVITAALITIGSIGSSLCMDDSYFTIYGQIACWRFFLGAGVGGEYPLAATVTSESSSAARRGALMAAVFSMQGFGSMMSVLIVLLNLKMGFSTGFVWRFSLAFGAVPAMLAFPWRLRMHETESFERVKQARLEKEQSDATSSSLTTPNSHNLDDALASDSLASSSSSHGLLPPSVAPRKGGLKNKSAPEPPSSSTPLISLTQPPGYSSTEESLPLTTTQPTSHYPHPTRSSLTHTSPSHNSHSPSPSLPSHSHTHTHSHSQEISRAFLYYKWHMLGTALTWFLLDVDFYANGLFNHDVTASILSKGKPTTAMDDAFNSMILCLIAVPGYFLSVLLIDKVGRKNVQMIGFSMMAILFLICGFGHDWFLSVGKYLPLDVFGSGIGPSTSVTYKEWLFLVVYSLTFLFSNFGPNTTTFIIPGEIYPAEVRATCHGFSAASGKLGAAFGAFFFPMILNPNASKNSSSSAKPTSTSGGLSECMFICAGVAVLGALVTLFLTPSYGAEELDNEHHYLRLDFEWLWPSKEDLESLRLQAEARARADEMVQVVESCEADWDEEAEGGDANESDSSRQRRLAERFQIEMNVLKDESHHPPAQTHR